MDKGTRYGNINILYLRNATEASLAQIESIGNVNMLAYTQKTASLVPTLKINNINTSVELPESVKLQNSFGKTVINQAMFSHLQEPVFMLCFGQTVVEADAAAADIEKWIHGLTIFGQLVCPEDLLGLIKSKASQVFGDSQTYPRYPRVQFNFLTLTERALQQMPDGTELAVVNGVNVPAVLPNELVARKLKKLYVSGVVTCHEENYETLREILAPGSKEIEVIPAGYELIEKPIILDSYLLEALPSPRLYCQEKVTIAADVEASLLESSLESLKCQGMLLCPAGLRSVLAQKLNLLEANVVFYEGELIEMEGSHSLSSARLAMITGKATLMVTGELHIKPDVTPEQILEKLAKVHYMGAIHGSSAQLAAIEARSGIADGALLDTMQPKDEAEESGATIGNANYLEL
jgi:hypothetical protein